MATKIKIIREDNNVESLITALNESKENIKDVFCAIRFADGTLWVLDQGVPFETLCTISKKLDLIIDYRQQDDEDMLAEIGEEDLD